MSTFKLQIILFKKHYYRTADQKEMQTILSEEHNKLQQGMQTRCLSNQSAVDALRESYKAVKLVVEKEASKGDATALGLS